MGQTLDTFKNTVSSDFASKGIRASDEGQKAYNDITGSLGEIEEKWSKKYKDSINCSNPRGFSQRAHCAGRKKKK